MCVKDSCKLQDSRKLHFRQNYIENNGDKNPPPLEISRLQNDMVNSQRLEMEERKAHFWSSYYLFINQGVSHEILWIKTFNKQMFISFKCLVLDLYHLYGR